ncbi:hypothetical protein TraAM80_09236 [Trypanosoma rangeli]|uniref:Uncharacterized protein n=1 Tax=Trypanosoma rangeli TaxID=5698 RepID=A0A3R7MZW4_TRYRA|nr:uncharacterized protein TraAM80_09236 [Trypanosoma rangeli]RNE97722.1 hypothetical protein TraAM80_09236 [Trypanosoma rangeli]|eukprot:RNE97722.1 hypothetical protein TraAM80_09236 [Trypanosoma rangeli]
MLPFRVYASTSTAARHACRRAGYDRIGRLSLGLGAGCMLPLCLLNGPESLAKISVEPIGRALSILYSQPQVRLFVPAGFREVCELFYRLRHLQDKPSSMGITGPDIKALSRY